MFYVKKPDAKTMEIWQNPNELPGDNYEHVLIGTYISNVKAYDAKIEDTIIRRWNIFVSNRMREIEEINRKTGEIEHFLAAKK